MSETPAFPTIDPAKVRETHRYGCDRGLLACRFDPTGRYVVFGGMDNKLWQYQLAVEGDKILWDKPGVPIILAGHKTWLSAVAFQPDGQRFFSADHAGQVHAWKFPAADAAQQPLWSKPAHQGWARAIAVSPDNQLLATCGNDQLVRLWSTADGALVRELSGHESHVYNLAFHPSGERLATAELRGGVKDWEVATGKFVRDLEAANMFTQQANIRLGGARSMLFSPDGATLACGGMTGIGSIGDGIGSASIVLFDWATGKQTRVLVPKDAQRSFVTGIHFHPAGFILGATGGLDQGVLFFWNATDNQAYHKFKLADSAWSMSIHPDQLHLVIAYHGRVLAFLDLAPPAT